MKLFKTLFSAVICLCLVSLLSMTVWAEEEAKLPNITVAICADFEPFEYIDDGGNICGIDVDIMNELCKIIGLKPTYTNTGLDSVIPSVKSSLADVAISAITPNEQREKIVGFTEPYLTCKVYNPNLDKWFEDSYAIVVNLDGKYKEEFNSAIATLKENGTIDEIAQKHGLTTDAEGMLVHRLPRIEPKPQDSYKVSSWAKASVEYGITNNWTFPEDFEGDYTAKINREQFCEITYNMLRDLDRVGTVNIADTSFKDTDNTKVLYLAQEGIISGKGDGNFAPEDYLTRAEAASILYRVARYNGMSFPEYSGAPFADDASIAQWAKEYIYFTVSAGIMSGTGDSFSPTAPYTAEQAVSTIERLYKLVK